MSDTDICFYMAITKEENSAFVLCQSDNSGLVSNLGASFRRRSMKVLNKGVKKEFIFKRTSVADVGIHMSKPAGTNQPSPSSPMKQRTPLLSSEPSDDTKYSSTKVNKPSVLFQQSVEQIKIPQPSSSSSSSFPADCNNTTTNCQANLTLTYHKSYAKPANLASEENSTSELDVDYDEKDDDDDEDDAFSGDDEDEDAEEAKDRRSTETLEVDELYCGFPPITPYIGTSPIHCHLMKTPRPLCCLNLSESCIHCKHTHAHKYKWKNRSVIVAADRSSNALYNFVVPLRSHSRHKESLHPIVLLLEEKPNLTFLETICHFPIVYWMIGSIDRLDDLFLAGIQIADSVVVVNKESSNAGQEETLADCNTIVAVQSMFRLFPSANIVTELSQAPNMRFMQFRAKDTYALQLSKLEKKEKERGSQLYFMFRLPFAAGNVFTSSMLDTLLYQAFVKDYVIKFVRLLLGIDQEVGSGYLACIHLSDENLAVGTYGHLYQKLCSTTHQIPLGIYRTLNQNHDASNNCGEEMPGTDELEIKQMVKCRLISLGLPLKQPKTLSCDRESISYVILNPEYDLELAKNDVIYAINPFSLSPQVTVAMTHNS